MTPSVQFGGSRPSGTGARAGSLSLAPSLSLALSVALALLAAPGCGSEAADTAPTPEERFRDLERRLLAADGLRIESRLVAEGAFEAELQGTLDLAPGGLARSEFIGSFGGRTVELTFVSDGRETFGRNGAEEFRGETGPELAASFIVGMTRMGLLHNQARLVGGSPPDHAGGGVEEWVVVGDFAAHGAPDAPDAPDASGAIRFAIRVAGEPAGEATLWLDPRTGLPTRREQTVVFGEQEMRVTETYALVRLDPPERARTFEVPR